MKLTSEGLRELYQTGTSRAARHRDNCLPGEVLMRAAAGEISRTERQMVADHLATCSDCAKEYSSIRSIKSWVDDVSKDLESSPETRNAPSRLVVLPRGYQGERFGMRPPFWERLVGSRWFSFYVPYAIATVLLILTFALGAQLINQHRENQRLVAQVGERRLERDRGIVESTESLAETRRQLEAATRRANQEESARRSAQEELAKRSGEEKPSPRTGRNQFPNQQPQSEKRFLEPHINIPIFDLDPRNSARGQQDGAATGIEMPADVDLFTLILNVSGEQVHTSYSLEVLDHRGRTIWVGRGLRKSPYNSFSLALPRRSFPAGEYQLKLYGLKDGHRELIEDYAVRLRYR